jgi:hypothetical protein
MGYLCGLRFSDAHSKLLDKKETANKSFLFSPVDSTAMQLLGYSRTSGVNFTNKMTHRQESLSSVSPTFAL